MDYEKRNKEILEKLRALRDDWASTDNRAAKEIEEAIPELIESEDERIRKAILELVRQSSEILEKKNQEQMIAWLEKRAEQKTAEWSEIEPIIQHLDNLGNTAMADILRSFEPQPHWKPSDEQMVALDGICSYIRNKAEWEISQDMVSDLYKLSEQLTKLKG